MHYPTANSSSQKPSNANAPAKAAAAPPTMAVDVNVAVPLSMQALNEWMNKVMDTVNEKITSSISAALRHYQPASQDHAFQASSNYPPSQYILPRDLLANEADLASRAKARMEQAAAEARQEHGQDEQVEDSARSRSPVDKANRT